MFKGKSAKYSTFTHKVDLVRFVNATAPSGRYLMVDGEKILEMVNTAEPLRQGAGVSGNMPLAMETMIKDLSRFKPIGTGDTTLEATPQSSQSTSAKSAGKRPASSSESEMSVSDNEEKAPLVAEKLSEPQKTSTPKKPATKSEVAKKMVKKEPA